MAQFKYAYYVAQSGGARFDHVTPEGVAAPHSGIYRCEGCGREIASRRGEPLPAATDHEHTAAHGSIRWRLAVATQ